VPVKNYACAALLFVRENPVVIRIQEAENRGVGLGPAAIFENLDVRTLRDRVLNPCRQLDRTVVQVITPHKTADEADHNRSRRRFGTSGHSGVGYRECGEHSSRRRSGQNTCNQHG
jgi:hypothetical protein